MGTDQEIEEVEQPKPENNKLEAENSKLKKQLEELKAELKSQKESHAAEINQLKIEAAVEKALDLAKSKNNKAVKALLDLGNAELLEDGSIKGLSEQIKALSEAEDSKFLFESGNSIQGFTPGEPKEKITDISPDIAKMSYDELCNYLNDNPNATL